MDTTQILQLRAAIAAETNAELVQLRAQLPAAGITQQIADWYNQLRAPAFYVWRSSLSRHEILTGASDDGTTFAWAAGAYITRSQGERDAFREMFNSTGTVNPALPSIQAAFTDIFSGTGGAGNRAHIVAMSRRALSRVERIFATGVGSKASPGTVPADAPALVTEFEVRQAVYNDDGSIAV